MVLILAVGVVVSPVTNVSNVGLSISAAYKKWILIEDC